MARSNSTPESSAPAEEEALIRAHLAAIAWIETHLLEPMTVKSIADRAGYSPSRFARGFTRLQGESVMSYVWGRRLEAALRRLLTEPGARIVDLAFDSGFDSQEAFTRAFAKAFGQPPGRLRSLGPVSTMVRRQKVSRFEPEIHERVEQVPDLHLAGLARHITPVNSQDMIDVWRRLESFRDSVGAVDSNTYLVILGVDARDGGVELMPSLRIPAEATPAAPLRPHRISSSTCAVFRHVVRKGDVFPQIQAARAAILARRHPETLRPVTAPRAFEVYPHGLSVTPGSWVDHYFPIARSVTE